MPRRDDIHSILVIGSGPIVIGQACEFDYSGCQACKVLRAEGFRVILVNSNPATIMTDPEFADRTYIEPVEPGTVAKIIEKERPDALLPTLGGQTALNVAMQLATDGVLDAFGVKMIGASKEAIHKGEDREAFRQAMRNIGLDVPRSELARTMPEARAAMESVGLPCVIRPAYTLGGAGGGLAYNVEEFEEIARRGLALSMVHEILVEESIHGWKEFELEVMRDRADNVVIVCSIENFDPMGIHTGDSITVAPAQTLTDKEYQVMRDASIAIIREIGVETGGSNIQFGVDPASGRLVVIEMNPRVSRSSALASKATGFPIAKIAAKLAVGYTLDEIPNDITKETPASFEPTIDYTVVKIPRFTFEKFPTAKAELGTQMKSVGEVMAIGRTFPEALQKAMRGLETGRAGMGLDRKDRATEAPLMEHRAIREKLTRVGPDRLSYVRYAFHAGMDVETIHEATKIDRWFLEQIAGLVRMEGRIRTHKTLPDVPDDLLREAKQQGFSDAQLAHVWKTDPAKVRGHRLKRGIRPVYNLVDTCAAEFAARTPYYYSTYETESEIRPAERPRILILGGGPNRIGQGIEFDYCCVHAAYALKEIGYEAVMVNSNPETVSTDYDTSDHLFFEPLTVEDVLNVWEATGAEGAIVQFGGQTPLNLAEGLERGGVKIIGTQPADIDRAEDREEFRMMLRKLGLRYPDSGIAHNEEEAIAMAEEVGYPVLVRPSYVLGGRGMEIAYDREGLKTYIREAVEASPEHPVQIDKFLEDATEIDVDAIADAERCVIGGIMEHIEEAGIHSGDSSCVLGPSTIPEPMLVEIRDATRALAAELNVRGLMNIQFAISRQNQLHVLEVNPRASRTVPFVSKATGVPLAKFAAQVMVGKTLADLGLVEDPMPEHFSVKEPVFPFNRFPGVDVLLGPEMRSTGEVMGIDPSRGCALAKAKLAAGQRLPRSGRVFISVKDSDKRAAVFIAQRIADLGFEIVATAGTHKVLTRNDIPSQSIHKVGEGRPSILDAIKNGEIHLVINTPSGKDPRADEAVIRSVAVSQGIPCITTISGATAAISGMEAYARRGLSVNALQDILAGTWAAAPLAAGGA